MVWCTTEQCNDGLQQNNNKKLYKKTDFNKKKIKITIKFKALFRCAPDHEHRPIFNWMHSIVGTSAHILGGKIPFGYNVLLRVPGLLSFKTMFVSVFFGIIYLFLS
jgi:hypothetical protein